MAAQDRAADHADHQQGLRRDHDLQELHRQRRRLSRGPQKPTSGQSATQTTAAKSDPKTKLSTSPVVAFSRASDRIARAQRPRDQRADARWTSRSRNWW